MFRSHRDTFRTPVKPSKEIPKKYYCDLCDKEETPTGWDMELDAEIHRRRIHKEELVHLMREPNNFMCCICLRQQTDHQSLIAHIKTHHLLTPADGVCVKREIFICDYCHNLFFNKLLLIAHINYFHLLTLSQKRNTRTPCPACFKHVKIRSIWFHFQYHGLIHKSTCPICLATFKEYTEVLRHAETHTGFYSCTICSYEAKKENLFLNHIEKHRKQVNIEEKCNEVSKYFVPQWKIPLWSRKFVNIFKGVTLAPELLICVLCRAICETEEQMKQHIYGDHTPENVVEVKRHMCVCGEEFFNNVLLKHHVFTMKGDHKACDASATPSAKRRRIDTPSVPDDNISNDTWIEVQIEDNTNIDNDNEIVIKDNSSDSEIATDEQILYVPIVNDDDDPLMKVNDCNEAPSSINVAEQSDLVKQSNDTATEILNQNQRLLYVTIDENESDSNTNKESTEPINETRSNTDEQMVYLSVESSDIANENNSQVNDIDQATSKQSVMYVTINHNSDIPQSNSTPIRKGNDEQRVLNSTVSNIKFDNQILSQNNIVLSADQIIGRSNESATMYQINDDRNVIIGGVPKMFKSSKQYYEEVVSGQDNMNEIGSGRLRSSETIGYVAQPSQEAVVYEVLEVPADATEDAGRLMIEESILFS